MQKPIQIFVARSLSQSNGQYYHNLAIEFISKLYTNNNKIVFFLFDFFRENENADY